MTVFGMDAETVPRPHAIESQVWSNILEKLSRQSQRMIPWKTGRKCMWGLTDRIEEIYFDDYARENVSPEKKVVLTASDQIGNRTTCGIPRSNQEMGHSIPLESNITA